MAPTSWICRLFRHVLVTLAFLVGGLSSAWAAPSLPDGRWTPQGYEVRVPRGMVADVLVAMFASWYAESARSQGFANETLDLQVLQAANGPDKTRTSCVRGGKIVQVSLDAWSGPACRRYLGLYEGTWLLVPSQPPGRSVPAASAPPSGPPADLAPPPVADPADLAAACLREEACRSRVAAMGLLHAPPANEPSVSVAASPPPSLWEGLLLAAILACALVVAIAAAAYLGARRGGKVFAQRLLNEMQRRLDAALASAAVATGQARAAYETAHAAYAAAEEVRQYALSLEQRLEACLGSSFECLQFLGLDPQRFPGDQAWRALPKELAAKAQAMTERVNGSLGGFNLSLGGQMWFDRPLRAISLLAAELRQKEGERLALETRVESLHAVLVDAADAVVATWDTASGYAAKLGLVEPAFPEVIDRLTGLGLYDVGRRSSLPGVEEGYVINAG